MVEYKCPQHDFMYRCLHFHGITVICSVLVLVYMLEVLVLFYFQFLFLMSFNLSNVIWRKKEKLYLLTMNLREQQLMSIALSKVSN